MKEYRKEKRKDRKRKIDEAKDEESTGPIDEMAAIMGFSGFGSLKKK
jgi:U4/U6.U5 tri-snRNP component SNU23